MSQFYEMEWNSKWDWENFFGFGPKSIESPKKLQLVDWEIVDDGEIDGGSFNLFGGGGDSGASGSDGGRGSSAKSSISASTDSSIKDRFSKSEGSFGNFSKNPEMKGSNKEASIGSAEALIGLKLGKRTYFENSNGGVVVKSASFSAISTPATKKTKSSCQNSNICCQVLGCNADLSSAKEYHRKHRVCDNHSKCPKVIVGGVERRFCQQCSRFHCLSEFDEKKRSCRRRLSDHNARRRKPQQETVQFNSTRFSSPFCGGNQEMSFLLSNTPLVHSRTPESFAWDRACNSKFTLTKGCPFKSYGDGGTDEPMHMPGIKLPRAIYMQNGDNGLSATKNPTSEILDPGSKGSMISSVDEAPEYSRSALSLLSSDSRQQESAPLSHPILQTQAIPDSMPLSSSEFWLAGQHSAHSHFQSLPTNSNFQEIQLFKAPYDADFYSNIY